MSETTLPSPDPDAGELAYRQARERLAQKDTTGASAWLEKASALGHPGAMTELGFLHLYGFDRPVDPTQAVRLLLQAEIAGGAPATSYLLALVASGGVALPHDPARITAWIADSARRGHPAGLRVAALLFGQGTDTGHQRAAVACLRRATAARDPISAALFADRLHAGRGVRADPAQALQLADELRAMGIPVELPEPKGSIETAESAVDDEPPWDSLAEIHSRPTRSVRQHCASPEIAVCDDLLGDEECRFLIYSGARFLNRSQVIDPATGDRMEFEVRTSHEMNFVPTSEDAGIRMLQRRMAALAGFGLDRCEQLTLLRYGLGDQYRPHRDYFFPSAPDLARPGGQRHSTVCVYLNAVERGGETVFPECDVTVEPKRGRAVMFRSLHADGSPDPRSLHAGSPVLAGEKWLASCWIRCNSFRAF